MIHIVKRSRCFLSAGLVILASLIACKKTPIPASPLSDSRIIIFSASATKQLASYGWEAPFWEPSNQQVLKLEAALPEYLRGNPAGRAILKRDFQSYGRQYFGISKKGKNQIYLNAFCRPEKFPNRKMSIVRVLDGGACYFQVIYDPEENKFSDFSINGEA